MWVGCLGRGAGGRGGVVAGGGGWRLGLSLVDCRPRSAGRWSRRGAQLGGPGGGVSVDLAAARTAPARRVLFRLREAGAVSSEAEPPPAV